MSIRVSLLIAALIGAVAWTATSSARACGPYGVRTHVIVGEVVSADAPTAGFFTVEARCGDDVYEVEVAEDGSFAVFGVTSRACTLVATAHECYTHNRVMTREIELPTASLTLVIPEHD